MGIDKFAAQFEERQYVFELEGVPRDPRMYLRVRYPFRTEAREEVRADWQGETFSCVFGTTYTPLELFIINSGVKGPSWVRIEKQWITETKRYV